MPQSKRSDQPTDLSAHRAARGREVAPATASAASGEVTGAGEEPTAFEESPTVLRARNLERLREAVDAGDYRPDPGGIAESMLDNERS